MKLPPNKTKIVATIGPASKTPDILEQMIRAGMNVARLNFSHGEFAEHQQTIENIHSVAKAVGQRAGDEEIMAKKRAIERWENEGGEILAERKP